MCKGWLWGAVAVACSGTTGGKGVIGDASTVVALSVEPAEVTLETSADVAGTQVFTAIATYDDGTEEPLTELVSWDVSNQAAGEIADDGLFTASVENGGVATVKATHNGISGTAALTVRYTATEGDGDAADYDGTPSGDISWYYPDDGVVVPRNVPSLTFMWAAVSGADGYRLSFTTDTTQVYYLTTETRATVEGERWASIAATNSGGEVQIEVRALAGGTLYGSETRTLTVNRLDASGSIYYWSTTEDGIVRVGISDDAPELFYSPRKNADHCVACHVVREDRMAVTYGLEGVTNFATGITDISGAEPSELTTEDKNGYYNTLNPDGTRLISSTTKGGLNLWDATTGEFLKAIDVGDNYLTMPDWSPDGTMLTMIRFIEDFGATCDNCWHDGELVVASIDDDGNLGEIVPLYTPPGVVYERDNCFYPSFSPDGEWIAFNIAPGWSYDNDAASLYVISVAGGDPIPMASANQGENLANAWPHWGPLPDDDVYWLTFSSKRSYGDLVTDGRPQVWVAAFHPDLAAEGLDPSSPAFWLPNQDIETSNHTTFWGP